MTLNICSVAKADNFYILIKSYFWVSLGLFTGLFDFGGVFGLEIGLFAGSSVGVEPSSISVLTGILSKPSDWTTGLISGLTSGLGCLKETSSSIFLLSCVSLGIYFYFLKKFYNWAFICSFVLLLRNQI